MAKICSVDGCGSLMLAKGLCSMHYERKRKTGSTELPPKEHKVCTVDGCACKATSRGLCPTHYARWRTTGTTELRARPRIVGVAKCSIDGCESLVHSAGLCAKHGWRVTHYGSTEARPRKRIPLNQKFWKFVVQDGPTMPHMDTPCWDWSGSKGTQGYGRVQSLGNGPLIASRFSYELHFGAIPEGLCVLHKCDNPACTKPEHLFLGTMKDNTQDMIRKMRHAHGERAGTAKLSEQQARTILIDDRSLRAIAADYGVNKETVRLLKLRKHWAHL